MIRIADASLGMHSLHRTSWISELSEFFLELCSEKKTSTRSYNTVEWDALVPTGVLECSATFGEKIPPKPEILI